jgi:uncharacterized membrane protein YphA (DoxX/SURF4 family)
VHRLFITFPDGAPGIGLLLLRLAVGASLATFGCGASPYGLIILIGLIVIAAALVIGFMTRAAAVLVATLHLLCALWTGFSGGMVELTFVAQALALALLGAGNYSLDSRLFGRRLVFELPRS